MEEIRMEKSKIKELVSQMTVEEKAAFCVGKDFWHVQIGRAHV